MSAKALSDLTHTQGYLHGQLLNELVNTIMHIKMPQNEMQYKN